VFLKEDYSLLVRVTISACKLQGQNLTNDCASCVHRAHKMFLSLVGDVNLVVDKNRVDGSRVRLAEVEVGDETGTVSLRARDEQIDVLKEVSDRCGAVVLRNSTLELYQGKHVRLAITKWGKLIVYPDNIASTPPPPSKINRDRNFSLIDLSLVASEMVDNSQGPYNQSQQETENLSMSSANNPRRQGGGQGGGRRPPAHAKPGGMQQNMPPPVYTDPTMASRTAYQGGLHGYGMDSSYSYPSPRQQENPPSAQMMLHQQYEMQQRQMHHMYQQQGPPRQDGPSAMLTPGIPPATSFDSNFSSGSNPFLMQQYGGPPHGHPGQAPDHHHEGAHPGKMNPQAQTFDPNRRPPDAP
jgi:replication factor A1